MGVTWYGVTMDTFQILSIVLFFCFVRVLTDTFIETLPVMPKETILSKLIYHWSDKDLLARVEWLDDLNCGRIERPLFVAPILIDVAERFLLSFIMLYHTFPVLVDTNHLTGVLNFV